SCIFVPRKRIHRKGQGRTGQTGVKQGSFMPLLVLIAALAAILSAGCSSSGKLTKEESCQARWTKLHEKLEKRRFNEIREPYTDLITSCHGSEFTEQASFELGEIHYGLGDWMEAESEFANFLREFPMSRKYGEIAAYRQAMSAARQVGIPQRDQSKT